MDPDQGDKAVEFRLGSWKRPHMRAFHASWWGFFCGFLLWFSIVPLLPTIAAALQLSKQDIWTASIVGLSSTILVRLIVGPLCDVYGSRVPFALLLCVASIPTALTGLVQNSNELYILRFFIGIAGGTFVPCEYWVSQMFAKEVVGTANALVAGWGNLGAGMTQLIMGLILFPIFQALTKDDNVAWRTVCIVPAVVAFLTGLLLYKYTDDAPKGNYSELKKVDIPLASRTLHASFFKAASNRNTILLFLQYACCFGVELTMNQAAALYFRDEFGMSQEAGAAIASIFGWLDFFARALGGILSDLAHSRTGMRGRLVVQTVSLVCEGALILVFASCHTLAGSIVALVFFSLFVKIAEGSTCGIVPYVDPPNMGSVFGVTGAGGNVGAVAFGLMFRQLHERQALTFMGVAVLASSILSVFVAIHGHRSLLWGRDRQVDPETGLLRPRSSSKSCSEGGSDARLEG